MIFPHSLTRVLMPQTRKLSRRYYQVKKLRNTFFNPLLEGKTYKFEEIGSMGDFLILF